MILHDMMENGPNPNSSYKQVNSLVNRRLKLPPIATSYKGDGGNNDRYSNGNSDLESSQSYNLPHIGLQNVGRLTDTSSKDLMESTFSFPRVYTVLPPIGKTFVPAASATFVPSAPSSIRNNKRSSRRPRVQKLQESTQLENVSKDINVSNSELHVDNESVIKTSVDGSEKTNSESILVDKPAERVQPKLAEKCVENKNLTETSNSDNLKLASRNKSSETAAGLGSDTIYASISETVRNDNVHNDNEFDTQVPFPQFCTIPEELRLYADVYPPSPPPNERKAKIMVEKTRQMIAEDNNYRISFFEDGGYRRRNATCAELDETLKNAVQLLRELFLRKTMEELCMLW